MNIARAGREHVDLFIDMRREAAGWLASLGSDQWQTDWPDQDSMRAAIEDSIAARTGWIATIGGEAAATWILDSWANPDLWTPAEQAEPAMYVHRLIVRRRFAGRGVGAQILDWCSRYAAQDGAYWLRLDAWTTNYDLHQYYQRQGFEHIRTQVLEHNPSGWIAQRATNMCCHRAVG